MARALVPLPIQVVVDDVGWRSGKDDSANGGAYRTGVDRLHGVADYAAITRLGRGLGVRPQAAMVMCDWDRADILRRVPSATWMGAEWRNPYRGEWMDPCGELLRREREHIELTLHGVGHECWHEPGKPTRAEWHDAKAAPRPRAQWTAHLDAYQELFDQHGFGAFPTSYVPPAGHHRVGSGFAPLLAERGMRLMSTPFACTGGSASQRWPWFDADDGVMLVERGPDPEHWNRYSAKPAGDIDQPVLGMHWPNLLHVDPARNVEIVDAWIAHLAAQGRRPGRMLARDSGHLHDQLAYHACLRPEARADGVALDPAEVRRLPLRVGHRVAIDVVDRAELRIDAHDARVVARDAWQVGEERVHRLDLELTGDRPRLSWRPAA